MIDLISRLRNPTIFQGSLRRQRYFEGWYFKHVDRNGSKLAVIPGISLAGIDSHVFVQVFNGTTGESNYFSYPMEEFKPEKEPFGLIIGGNRFGFDGLRLDIDDYIKGELRYSGITPYTYPWFERGVMGWYGYIPFMETYHGLLSFDHRVSGSVEIGGKELIFDGGDGYIEKDWGESFPSSWIWMQSNSFNEEASFMFSTAVIPWLGSSFIGHIAVLNLVDETFNLSTYRGGKITRLDNESKRVRIRVETRKHTLVIDAQQGESVQLKSPEKGLMTGRTIESLDSRIDVKLLDKNGALVFYGVGANAGLEIMDEEGRLGRGLGL
jgi:hypothetical protein